MIICNNFCNNILCVRFSLLYIVIKIINKNIFSLLCMFELKLHLYDSNTTHENTETVFRFTEYIILIFDRKTEIIRTIVRTPPT